MDNTISIANRVCQLESNSLDTNLNEILDHHVDNLESSQFSNELKLLSKLYLTINMMKTCTTPGMNVYKMRFQDFKSISADQRHNKNPGRLKLILLTGMNMVLPYILEKIQDSRRARSLIDSLRYPWMTKQNASDFIKAVNIFNFLIFLREGKYLNVQNRILGLIPCVEDKYHGFNIALNRVQMQIIHRETNWKYIAEFILTVTPHVNLTWLKNRGSQISDWFVVKDEKSTSQTDLMEKFRQKNSEICAECSKQPFNPHSIGCRHIFCYYCITSRYMADTSQGFKCKDCNFVTKSKSDVVPVKLYDV